ncbi:MAG: GAF and ANTAR domain-containing protein [Actinomycetota bacterium]|nr:GAF and ANTAR domain-containing protein [Actinomycetota bacterium]
MSTVTAERVAEMFVEFADTLVAEFDLVEFLQMVTVRASEVVGAAEVGLLLADPQGELQFMAASDERSELLELFQVQSNEGPCQDCFRQAAPVINADLREASARWPLFAPRAVAAGFRSVHAFPMRLRDEVIGALNLFGTEAGRMEPADVLTVQALADVATIGLLQERAVHRGEILTEQLQGALSSRVIIEQAKGAIAQMRGCSVDEAFTLLRGHCRNHNLRLSTVAHAVVTDPTPIPGLTTA